MVYLKNEQKMEEELGMLDNMVETARKVPALIHIDVESSSHDHESSHANGGLSSFVSTQTLKSIPDVVQNYEELRKLQDLIS